MSRDITWCAPSIRTQNLRIDESVGDRPTRPSSAQAQHDLEHLAMHLNVRGSKVRRRAVRECWSSAGAIGPRARREPCEDTLTCTEPRSSSARATANGSTIRVQRSGGSGRPPSGVIGARPRKGSCSTVRSRLWGSAFVLVRPRGLPGLTRRGVGDSNRESHRRLAMDDSRYGRTGRRSPPQSTQQVGALTTYARMSSASGSRREDDVYTLRGRFEQVPAGAGVRVAMRAWLLDPKAAVTVRVRAREDRPDFVRRHDPLLPDVIGATPGTTSARSSTNAMAPPAGCGTRTDPRCLPAIDTQGCCET